VNTFYYGVLFLNFVFPASFAVSRGMDLPKANLTFQLVIWTEVFTCLVLYDACRRMYVFIREKTVSSVNVGYLILHLTIYSLYLLSVFYYWWSVIVHPPTTDRQFMISISIRGSFQCLSMVGMAFMFYKLCTFEEKPDEPAKVTVALE